MSDYAIIVADGLEQAHNTAEIDWGWARVAKQGQWQTAGGERVVYAGDHHQSVHGLSWGTRIYLGYRWYARSDAAEIRHLMDVGRLIKAEPAPPSATQP